MRLGGHSALRWHLRGMRSRSPVVQRSSLCGPHEARGEPSCRGCIAQTHEIAPRRQRTTRYSAESRRAITETRATALQELGIEPHAVETAIAAVTRRRGQQPMVDLAPAPRFPRFETTGNGGSRPALPATSSSHWQAASRPGTRTRRTHRFVPFPPAGDHSRIPSCRRPLLALGLGPGQRRTRATTTCAPRQVINSEQLRACHHSSPDSAR